MYVINDYQLLTAASTVYMNAFGKGAKISAEVLADILFFLKQQERLEISEEGLQSVAEQYSLDINDLKTILIQQLGVVKPMMFRKCPKIYINISDAQIRALLTETLSKEYQLEVVSENFKDYQPQSMVIFYRLNYSDNDFKTLYKHLPEDCYVITAGVLHNLLIIDNLYFKDSGLPSHFSNLNQLLTYLQSDVTATKNNWLLFYRDIVHQQPGHLPSGIISPCQQGYIAFALHQFARQYTDLWQRPTAFDQVNWMWHVDLTSFNIHKEVAIHSAFSEYDQNIDINQSMEETA